MTTFTIRDVPENVSIAVALAAKAAGARSRESFLRDSLVRIFNLEGSTTAGIASRARKAVDQLEALGRNGALAPAPTIPLIARALGHADASTLESELRGDRPMSFSDGDKLCALFGISRTWLESGSEPQFDTTARFRDSDDILHHFLQNGVGYRWLYFILEDATAGGAAIIGHRGADVEGDLAGAWRYEMLEDEIPIHDSVGGTGRANRREFADLVLALFDDKMFPDPILTSGRVVTKAQYMALVSGAVHPAAVIGSQFHSSHWHEDFWSFDRRAPYTMNYDAARNALQAELRASGIITVENYRAWLRKRWKNQ